MITLRACLWGGCAWSAGSASLAAQVQQAQIVLEITGHGAAQEQFGRGGVVNLRDADGDGVGDFAVAGWASSTGPAHVAAYSGAHGSLLWDVTQPPGLGGEFASRITGGGDVDGDGVHDVLVYCPGSSVAVLSGADGALLRVHYTAGLGLGMQAPGPIFGDADGDGFDDYLLADNIGASWTGQASVVSGRTGGVLYLVPGMAAFADYWAQAIGDVDGDRLDDFVVSQLPPTGFMNSITTCYSGATGAVVWSNALGGGVYCRGPRCAGEDLDGDGIGDLITSNAVTQDGAIQAWSGATGGLIWQRLGMNNEGLGKSLGIVDDWDGDGRSEIMARASWPERWKAMSGQDGGDLVDTPIPYLTLTYGIDCLPLEDLDGDGAREILSRGIRQNPFWLPPASGSVFVTKHATGSLSHRREIGRACLSSNGHLPRCVMWRDPSLGTTAEFLLRGALPGAWPVFGLGGPALGSPLVTWDNGCNLLIDPLWLAVAAPTNATGISGVAMPVPAAPWLSGLELAVQWFVLDYAANPTGLVASTAVELRLGS